VAINHATRATLSTHIGLNGSDTQWKIEFATSKSGPWTVEGSGTKTAYAGNPESERIGVHPHHLTPQTLYYARASAVNASGQESVTTEFTTTAISAPEIHSEQEGNQLLNTENGTTYADWEARELETNGAATEYRFDYTTEPENPASWKPFTSGASGSVTAAEDFASPKARLTGLSPETRYSIRLTATNHCMPAEPAKECTVSEVKSFETKPLHPVVQELIVTDPAPTSAFLWCKVYPGTVETHWRFEYAPAEAGHAPAENSPTWSVVPAGTGTLAGAEADEAEHEVGVHLTGLSPGTTYYARFRAENGHPPDATSRVESLETMGPPVANTFATHAIDGESMRALGGVLPNTAPVGEVQSVTLAGAPTGGTFTLNFEGRSTAPIPFDASVEAVRQALGAIPGIGTTELGQPPIRFPNVSVHGNSGGPYEVEFTLAKAGLNLPQIGGDATGLTPSGTVTVATVQDGLSFDTHYHFEYVTEEHFKEKGFAEAAETAGIDLGPGASIGNGFATSLVGADLPELKAGETYRYRLTATNTTPGNPVVHGAEQTLTVPTPAKPGPQESCPNEALRSGPSAHLPDCRAYEQVTPANKEGALDTFNYSSLTPHTQVGEDGEHFLVQSAGTQWGASPDPLTSAYFFTRTPTGWQMTSARPAGEAGPSFYKPLLLSADLTAIGLEAGWTTGGINKSEDVEFKTGPVGGPYTAVAPPVPREDVEYEQALVAASAGGGKLILQTRDYQLLGRPTGTLSGNDLYEFAGGQLRQVNVLTGGSPISTCGARMVMGAEGYQEQAIGGASGKSSSSHAVSGDGSRVFFEDNCTHSLYMRVAGVETRDIGEYRFLGANPEGTKLVLEKLSGETHEIFSYDTAAALAKHLLSTREQVRDLIVSEELTAFYFRSLESLTPDAPPVAADFYGNDLYRYDIGTEKLGFVVQAQQDGGGFGGFSVSPDGRYFYFGSRGIAGVPGGGDDLGNKSHKKQLTVQAYRYDSVEGVVQCMSCASPFDREPKLDASFFPPESVVASIDGVPNPTVSSANGDYVFFNTAAALVPQDVDGEVLTLGGANSDLYVSVSTDVYEWRKDGVDGCVRVQGCLALISTGRGGLKVELLGTTASGRDVFFTTHESLVPQDADKAGDVYDARIGGGVSPPVPGPVECEGDACSTPASPPNDPTPTLLPFSGAVHLPGVALPVLKPKPKPKAGKKCKANARKKCKAKHKRRTGKKTKKSIHRGGK
jgi:hypothetical protein